MINIEYHTTVIEELAWIQNFAFCNSFDSFLGVLMQNDKLKEFIFLCENDQDAQNEVMRRIKHLVERVDSGDKISKEDFPIATYLYVLSQLNRELAMQASRDVLEKMPAGVLYWSIYMAKFIDKDIVITNDNEEYKISEELQPITNNDLIKQE